MSHNIVDRIMGGQTTNTSDRYIAEMGKIMTGRRTMLANKISSSKSSKMIGIGLIIGGVALALIVGGLTIGGAAGAGELTHFTLTFFLSLAGGSGGAMALVGLIVFVVGAVKGHGMKKLTQKDVQKWIQKDITELQRLGIYQNYSSQLNLGSINA